MSRYLPKATQKALSAQIVCQACGGPGPFEAAHIVAVALGGGNGPDNVRNLCKVCHFVETKRDIRMIAKANRIRKKREGKERRFKRKIRSRGFDKRWRRKMDGTREVRT